MNPGRFNFLLYCTSLCGLSLLAAPVLANPQGGVVSGGSAAISEAGKTLTVDQSSARAVIDWRSFNIAPDERTRFNQPSASAIALNRVSDVNPSQIAGQLSANGNIIIINPNGVLFSSTATVDVNGLVATTANIANDTFMNNNVLTFDQPGNPNATASNAGSITANAGLVAMVAPQVANSGVITAKLGKVALAAGDSFTLDLAGDGLLSVQVSDSVARQLVSNSGRISADG